MSINASVNNFTGRVTCPLPAGSGNYTLGNFRLEISNVDENLDILAALITPTSGTVTNPTSSVNGQVVMNNIPLSATGGNSIKVRYLKTPTEIVTLGVTGAFVQGYQNV